MRVTRKQTVRSLSLSYAHPSFFWFDNDKDLKVCFLVTHLYASLFLEVCDSSATYGQIWHLHLTEQGSGTGMVCSDQPLQTLLCKRHILYKQSCKIWWSYPPHWKRKESLQFPILKIYGQLQFLEIMKMTILENMESNWPRQGNRMLKETGFPFKSMIRIWCTCRQSRKKAEHILMFPFVLEMDHQITWVSGK